MGKKKYRYAVADKKVKGKAIFRYFVNRAAAEKFAKKRHHIVEPIKSKKAHQDSYF